MDERANIQFFARTKEAGGIGFYARTAISANRSPWHLLESRDRRRGGERFYSKVGVNFLWEIYDAI